MENEFVPYELALELKQLGFNEPCIRGWSMDKQVFYHPDSDVILDNPTFSQAFRWFRDNHNLYQQIGTFAWDYDKKQLGFSVGTYLNPLQFETEKKIHLEVYETYEEAELECLKKLIEIVKDGK